MAKEFMVYYPGPLAGSPKILKITEDHKKAVEAAERFVLENGGLRCRILAFSNVECVEEYPKKERENG